MDTISTYLDNMFAGLPATEEIARIKSDLQATMEDKYNELKWEGKSENEAIGIVISEFGNIDELKSELGLTNEPLTEKSSSQARKISMAEVEHFINDRKKYNFLIALGVFLCITAPAMFFLSDALFPKVQVLGLIVFFLMIGISISMFIMSAISLEKYNYFKQEFEIEKAISSMIERKQEAFRPTFILSLVIGVMLCFFSPLAVIVPGARDASGLVASFGIILLLSMVAAGVFLFINFGTTYETYQILLQTGQFEKSRKTLEQHCKPTVDLFASIYWPIMVLIYLFWSFTTNNWHFTWIIWPIAGISYGILETILKVVKSRK